MESARLKREQPKSEPLGGNAQRERAPVTSAPCRSLTLNDTHSPAVRLGHGFGSSHPTLPHGLQAKLTVNEPGDQYEQEADAVAAQVMRMHDTASHLQRKCGCDGSIASGEPCEQCASRPVELQRHPVPHAATETAAPDIVNEVLQSPGQMLATATRKFMESRFDQDFSDVRIHSGGRAAESARAVDALAYTVGRDVVFAAGQFAPGTASGTQLLAHELTHVIQQTGGARRVQRTTDRVNHRPTRPNARACLLHLHGDEVNARAVADDLYNNYCVNFAFIEHPGRRFIRVDVPGHAGTTCLADPNRIFENAALTSQWASWNRREAACLADPVMSAAQRAVRAFRDNQLCPAIRECRGQAASPGVCTQVQGLPTAVFHNNTPGAPLTIQSYQAPSGNYHHETETDPARLTDSSTTPPTVLANPHIEPGESADNVVIATDPVDFRFFVRQQRNVVLQKLNPPNDGSLSVYLRAGRYINIEALLPQPAPATNLPTNQAMGAEAMASLGITRGPCPTSAPAGSVTPTQTVNPAAPANPSPAPRVQRLMRKAPAVTHQTPRFRIQRDRITSANLRRQSSTDLDRFMRHVYDLQVQRWRTQGATYIHELAASELATLPAADTNSPGPVRLHNSVAPTVHSMLVDARSALAAAQTAGDPNARGVTGLAVRSGYRSAPQQLSIWERYFPRYYAATRAERQRTPGGEHSAAAAELLVTYFNQRVHSPGYSQHQRGHTIDLTFNQRGWIEPDTDPTNVARWRASWFFAWLTQHAAGYGFAQNPSLDEPWHWESQPNLLETIGQLLLDLLLQIINLIREPIRMFSGSEHEEERTRGQAG